MCVCNQGHQSIEGSRNWKRVIKLGDVEGRNGSDIDGVQVEESSNDSAVVGGIVGSILLVLVTRITAVNLWRINTEPSKLESEP